ncbi:MAG: hypothetical protein Q9217_006018 [Psora testacea]
MGLCLDSAGAIQRYLTTQSSWFRSHGSPTVAALTRIGSASTNHIYRVLLDRPLPTTLYKAELRSVIFKHAADKVPLTPHIDFHQERQQYEAAALREISRLLKSWSIADSIKLPILFDEDKANSVILMEDVGAEFGATPGHITVALTSFIKGPPPGADVGGLADRIGFILGSFLWELHSLGRPKVQQEASTPRDMKTTFAGHAEARRVCAETTYGAYLGMIESFGVHLSPEQRSAIQETVDSERRDLLSSKDTLVMGDFW